MTVYQPGKKRPWFRRKYRLGLLGSQGWKNHWGAILAQGDWFTLKSMETGYLDPKGMEALDALLAEDGAFGRNGPTLEALVALRGEWGLPGSWPVFQASVQEDSPASQVDAQGFGGVDLRMGPLDPSRIHDAAQRYAHSRKSSFSQAARTLFLYGSILIFLLTWAFSRLLFGSSELEETLEQIRSLDHPKLEKRLNQPQSKLARFVELCKFAQTRKDFEKSDLETQQWIQDRLRETEAYLAWVLPIKGVTEVDDAFRLSELDQSVSRAREMLANAQPLWRELESHRLLERLANENQERLTLARARLRQLDQWRRNGLEIGAFTLPVRADFGAWAHRADGYLAEVSADTATLADSLLEVVEARAALQRVVGVVRSERFWIAYLGKVPGKGDRTTMGIENPRQGWLENPVTAAMPPISGKPNEGKWADVSSLPSDFRERVAVLASQEAAQWLKGGARELAKEWPQANLSQGVPPRIRTLVEESPRWQSLRAWVIALRQLAAPVERPIPAPDRLDPWKEVLRLAEAFPPSGVITKIQVECPIQAKPNRDTFPTLDLVVGGKAHTLNWTRAEELWGVGVTWITFEPEKPFSWVGDQTMEVRLKGDRFSLAWRYRPQPAWAGWSPLLKPGTIEGTPPTAKGDWKLRIFPSLPEVPGLLDP